ncbi:MAG: hypothetical protein AABZ08_09395 [Planctomycetota bacterium]
MRRRFIHTLIYSLVGFVACVGVASAQDALNTGDIDPVWLESNRYEATRQVELLSAAYSLAPQQLAALQQEMEIRLLKQKAFEDKEMAELKRLADLAVDDGDSEDGPQVQAALAKMKFIAENQPFAEEDVAGWVEKSLGVADVVEGRQRWEELRFRHAAKSEEVDVNAAEVSGFKSDLASARTDYEATPVPVTGEPLPSGDKGMRLAPAQEKKRIEQGTVVPPHLANANPDLAPKTAKQQAAAKLEASKAETEAQIAKSATAAKVTPTAGKPDAKSAAVPETPRSAEAKPDAATPPPAPPLDDWDKHVLGQATKYQFDDAQMTNAQSILRDLKRRANQYRMSRSDAIARAQLMVDAKTRDAEMKILNRPIDALFEELKQRVESLPTADQRQKAGAATKSKDARK